MNKKLLEEGTRVRLNHPSAFGSTIGIISLSIGNGRFVVDFMDTPLIAHESQLEIIKPEGTAQL